MISKPLPGPVAEAPPEPIHNVAPPRMIQWREQAAPLVRRVTDADFDAMAGWLVPRLANDFLDADADAVFAWLRSMVHDTSAFLMRTPDMVALAEIRRTTLVPAGIVSEVFVRSRVQNNNEAIALYRTMRDWAISTGAKEFRFFLDSDAAMTHVIPSLFDVSREFAPKKRTIYANVLR